MSGTCCIERSPSQLMRPISSCGEVLLWLFRCCWRTPRCPRCPPERSCYDRIRGLIWWRDPPLTGSSSHIRWTSEKKIAPLGGVQLALLGKLDFEQVGFAMLRAAPHASTELSSAAGWDANSLVNASPLWNPHGKGGVYDANSLGVWYTGSAWSIFHQNMQPMVAERRVRRNELQAGLGRLCPSGAGRGAAMDRMGFARRARPRVLERALDRISQSPGLQRVRARRRQGIVATGIL